MLMREQGYWQRMQILIKLESTLERVKTSATQREIQKNQSLPRKKNHHLMKNRYQIVRSAVMKKKVTIMDVVVTVTNVTSTLMNANYFMLTMVDDGG